jgi:hypothetical protein
VDSACPGGDDCDDDPAGCGSDCHPGHTEVCDGQDNDCNPATTDGSEDPSLNQACDGPDSDLCEDDQTTCESGQLGCSAGDNDMEGPPGDPTCTDALDNDCDTLTDSSDPECSEQDVLEALLHGAASMPDTAADFSVALPQAVVSSRSILLFSYTIDSNQPKDCLVLGQLSGDGTEITFRRFTSGSAVEIRWTVVQLQGIAVQRGVTPVPDSDPTCGIGLNPSVDLSRSLPLVSNLSDGNNMDLNDWNRARLIDSSTLELTRGTGCCETEVAWQVVEFGNGAAVQTGELELDVNTTTRTVTIPQAVVTDQSVLSISMYPIEQQSPPQMSSHGVRGQIASTNELRFDREDGGVSMPMAWHLLSWGPLRVQHGTSRFDTGVQSRDITLTTQVDASRSFVWIPAFGRQGSSEYDADDAVGEAWFTAELSADGTTLVLTRATSAAPADLSWSVVELR